ncbi:MAG: AarF/ABC1/UbiB kinase family protein [Bacteroidetes bacterium]|nr:AarF/ABC1/UbiB kinase family protein [Bacteroidota bacterium]
MMTATDITIPIQRHYEVYEEKKPAFMPFRFFFTLRQLVALAVGGAWAELRLRRERRQPRKWRYGVLKFALFFFYPLMNRKLIREPFGVQFRKRLEGMGASYIKLGQILSLREDLLPQSVTDELKKLLDNLPAMPFDRFKDLVEENLEMPWNRVFAKIQEVPLGSASVAQVHAAILNNGDEVVIKLLKPGTRAFIETDSKIIMAIGSLLEFFIPRIQPKAMLTEFCDYTIREVDFRLEANNALEFQKNFAKYDTVKFPKVYKEHSNSDMLVMEYIKGMKPDEKAAIVLTEEQKSKVVDIGAFAIIKMMYNDGFFHADLHPGNLLIINEEKCAFIDLGMVGRFSEATRKNMLYYYNALVLGNAEAAARYLSLVAKPGRKADVVGFRKQFVHVANGWLRNPNFSEFSIGKLIMKSTKLGAKYGMYFPIEMVLMVKAMITFEGVGNVIKPDMNIAEVSKKHIRRHLIREVKPRELLKTSLQNAPEFIDTLTRGPGLFVELFNRMEQELTEKKPSRMEGMKGIVLGGFCLLGACVLFGLGVQPFYYVVMLLAAFLLILKS